MEAHLISIRLLSALEQFEDAIGEYKQALEAFGEPNPELLRSVAGIYFNLALSLEFISELGEAKVMYVKAKECLEQKKAALLTAASAKEDEDEKSAIVETAGTAELVEMQGLIKEISMKIEDLEVNNQAALSREVQNAATLAAASVAQAVGSTVNDLSGMVKKRKADDTRHPIEQDAKESKIDKASEVCGTASSVTTDNQA